MANLKIDDRALQLISDFYEIGGGAQVVTELPETGKEHTIYELHQNVSADFPWLFTEIDATNQYPHTTFFCIVVENEEQVTREYLQMPLDFIDGTYVYVKSTNNVYRCWIKQGEQENTFEKEIILPEKDKTYATGKRYIAILRDFDYHIGTGETEKPNLDGTGHFLDGSEFAYDNNTDIVPLVLTDATNKKYALEHTLVGIIDLTNSTKPILESDIVTKIDLSILNEVFAIAPVFVPQPAHTEVSYWIYSNDEWINMDNIGNTGTIYVSTDSYYELTQEKFYGNGKELEVEFVDTTPEGAELPEGYAIIKGVPIDTPIELTVSEWPVSGIEYNLLVFQEEGPITIIGAGLMRLSFSLS